MLSFRTQGSLCFLLSGEGVEFHNVFLIWRGCCSISQIAGLLETSLTLQALESSWILSPTLWSMCILLKPPTGLSLWAHLELTFSLHSTVSIQIVQIEMFVVPSDNRTEGKKVHIALGQNHKCIWLSIQRECKLSFLMGVEKNTCISSVAKYYIHLNSCPFTLAG